MRRTDYPRDWEQKSYDNRFGRAGGRRECAGECGSGHQGRCEARHEEPHPVTRSKVILTTAHRDRDPWNSKPEDLFAACQKCHLPYDAEQHRANAAWTRAGRPDQQLELFPANRRAA
jgi:hypothetical protein